MNASIVLEVILFLRFSFSALVTLRVITAPVVFQVPRIVPVTPGEKVLAMNPVGCSSQTKVPSPLIDMVSFKSPTVPFQRPAILAVYSASDTGRELCAHDAAQIPKTSTASGATQAAQLDFMQSTLSSFISLGFVVDEAAGAKAASIFVE